jgi:hypothetical protein
LGSVEAELVVRLKRRCQFELNAGQQQAAWKNKNNNINK